MSLKRKSTDSWFQHHWGLMNNVQSKALTQESSTESEYQDPIITFNRHLKWPASSKFFPKYLCYLFVIYSVIYLLVSSILPGTCVSVLLIWNNDNRSRDPVRQPKLKKKMMAGGATSQKGLCVWKKWEVRK